jgi:hypothetical protein
MTEGVTFHIPDEAAQRLLNKTERVPVPGYEKEYMVGLDVFHQLHCLVSRTQLVAHFILTIVYEIEPATNGILPEEIQYVNG